MKSSEANSSTGGPIEQNRSRPILDHFRSKTLTYDEAFKIAREFLDKMTSSSSETPEVVIVEEHSIEREFGWVFFYQSKLFLETGEYQHRLAGNGPIIVNRASGALHTCPTYQSVEKSIAIYEQQLEQGKEKK